MLLLHTNVADISNPVLYLFQCRWDHWYAPDGDGTTQYHLLRTQAQVYFSPEQHEALVDALLRFGESQLGCRAITPIWLSNYVDGCVQVGKPRISSSALAVCTGRLLPPCV
jgi:hypothetical protein